VTNEDMEPVDLYKVSKIKLISPGEQGDTSAPRELVLPELWRFIGKGDTGDWLPVPWVPDTNLSTYPW
jgi:hypothetical protein